MRQSLALGLMLAFATPIAHADQPLQVVTSFSVLADMVEQVGGERVEVASLVGADSDTHVFTPSPSDAMRLAEADLVVFNGLQLEGWMQRLLDASEYAGALVVASEGIETLASNGHDHASHGDEHGEHGDERHDEHEHGDTDPHAWLDVARGQQYVANIRDGLIEADPANSKAYRRNATTYLAELEALDAEIHELIGSIPEARRVVVTGHDAFGYFADAYHVRFLSPVGLNTAAAPSAADMGRLVDVIRDNNVQALFHENITSPALIRQLAEEAGLPIAGTLYSGALAAEGEGSTYVGMMRHNATLMHDGLAHGADSEEPAGENHAHDHGHDHAH
jgi:zinc/manganese transport system substrate-binding protein